MYSRHVWVGWTSRPWDTLAGMDRYLPRSGRRCAFTLACLTLAACNDGDNAATEGSTGAQGSTGAPSSGGPGDTEQLPTTSADTGSEGSGSASGSTSDASASTGGTTGEVSVSSTAPSTSDTGSVDTGTGGSSTGGEECLTELCGDPQVCCEVGEMCINAACVATCGDFATLDVAPLWSWTANEVTCTPLVADLQGDAKPELVVNATRIDGMTYELGEIVVLSGAGAELLRIKEDPPNQRFGSNGLSTPVLADVSGDGKPDIIYSGRQDGQKLALVHAVDGTGKLLWSSHTANNAPAKIRWDRGAAAVVNLDDDPEAEIAVGGALFDDDGLLVWNEQGKSGLLGTPTDNLMPPKLLYSGGLPTFADLTGDGKPELITGREAWTIDWAPGNPPVVAMTQLWKNTSGKGNDGWPAVADIDQNGTPEVILVAWPDIKVLDGKTGKLWCGVDPSGVMCEGNDGLRTQPIAIKGSNLGGPATIADFDGDGRPEAAIVGGVAFAVYDFNRAGETIVKPMADPMPAAGAMFARWFKTTQDNSSASTGSSAFDFQGDGAAELTYLDECRLYAYDGQTGATMLDLANSSATVHEYPLVVDLDGDGDAELLAVANVPVPASLDGCKNKDPGFVPRKGVFAYGSAEPWATTSGPWTQHSHHISNVGPGGNVPLMEQDNWTTPGLNNFRQSVQGGCE